MKSNAAILLIETATKNCSVAVSSNGKVLIELQESADHFIHAERLHVLISNALEKADVKPNEIAAVAVGKGPGSYTGLRIGVSAAKGLAFALDIPLLAVSTLQLMCDHARVSNPGLDFYIGLLDARRDELYMAVFNTNGEEVSGTTSVTTGSNPFAFGEGKKCCFIGDGVQKCMDILPAASISMPVLPAASMMATIATGKFAAGEFEDTDLFEPYYLKNFIPGITKKSVLG